MDNFELAGKDEILKEITEVVKKILDISKLENSVLRFTRIDVIEEKDMIELSMNDKATI